MTGAKKGARPKSPTAQDRKIAKLETEVLNLTWAHAELVYSTKVALAQLFIKLNPQVVQTLAERMVREQTQKGVTPQ